jgi:hypothetical protein
MQSYQNKKTKLSVNELVTYIYIYISLNTFFLQEILSSVYSKEEQEVSSVLGCYGVSLGENFLTFRGFFD